jgi:hypothetical protein
MIIQQPGTVGSYFAALPLTEQNKVLDKLSRDFAVYRRKRLLHEIALVAVPPCICYAFLFVVLPWIIKGFERGEGTILPE